MPSRNMSIFLLKPGESSRTALIEKHGLRRVTDADAVPPHSELWTAGVQTSTPWWQGYFGLPEPQKSANLGAILFLVSKNRTFALTFGQTSARLRDQSYEYDFGLRVSLNAVDPEKLKSTDVSEPGAGRRQRTQTGVDSALTFFDFDSDSAVMRSVTGKARTEHEDLVRQVTGATNLRIGTAASAEKLGVLCERLLSLYESEDYLDSFPGIENLQPVRDPQLITELDARLDVLPPESGAFLMLPEVVDYTEDTYYRYSGFGGSSLFGELELSDLRALAQKNDLQTFGAAEMRNRRVIVTDGNGSTRKSFALYRCINLELVSDVEDTYILHDGGWYLARKSFVEEMSAAIGDITRLTNLPTYDDERESRYNARVSDGVSLINLDQTNIAGKGRTQIEPADLLSVQDQQINLFHVKVSTRSSDLSHLFNQGINSLQLLLSEEDAGPRLEEVVRERASLQAPDLKQMMKESKFAVRYVIATHRDYEDAKFSLPFFSQITLWRAIRGFKLLRIPVSIEYVVNERERKASKQKPRKERSDKGSKRE